MIGNGTWLRNGPLLDLQLKRRQDIKTCLKLLGSIDRNASTSKGVPISITDGLVLLDGLPLHPLIIHVTVVALPLAVVMVVLSLTWQRFRKYDLLTLAVLVIGSGSAFLASMSGRDLSAKIGESLDLSTAGFCVPLGSTVLANFSMTSLAMQNMAKITR